MNELPLVSVIIPSFNRAELLYETLDSIKGQSYTHWECLIVDDGSTDRNCAVINEYNQLDSRFKLFRREDYNKPKGGNSCRNIGIDEAKGAFIVFFDSDDIMLENHLEFKVQNILAGNYDFIVTKTKWLNISDESNFYYDLGKIELNLPNYITQKINWLTYDIIIKSQIAKKITFNESLKSGQEYNYFSKLLNETTNAISFEDILTLRRKHGESIRSQLSDRDRCKNGAIQIYTTFLELEGSIDSKTKNQLFKMITYYLFQGRILTMFSDLLFVRKLLGSFGLIKSCIFFLSIIFSKIGSALYNFTR